MSTRKAALGKGLGALLPQVPSGAEADLDAAEEAPRSRLYAFEDRVRLAGRVAELDVDAIRPNPYQPRQDFDEAALDELAASITQLGIIQPLTVRALGTGRFELIAGERRLRAARRAGLKKVPAFVREVTDSEALLEMAIVENVQREDLNPIEVALGYHRLIEEVGLTQEQVAEKVGKDRSTIANKLRLLRLPPRIQASLRDGSLSPGHARMLVAIDDEGEQVRLHRAILDKGLSVRQVERLAKDYRERKERPRTGDARREGGPTPGATAEPEATALAERDRLQLAALEARLRDHLATQVRVRHQGDERGGTIEITYYSTDDLERVIERVVGA